MFDILLVNMIHGHYPSGDKDHTDVHLLHSCTGQNRTNKHSNVKDNFFEIFSMIYFAERAEGNRALIIDELKLSNFLIGLDLLIARNLHIMEKYKMRAKKTQIK